MTLVESVCWSACPFDELDARTVYLLAKLRVDVFVVEQACAYAELDGKDLFDDTVHILGTWNRIPIAYARIMAPDCPNDGSDVLRGEPVRIGRVVVERQHRQHGLAAALMDRVLEHCEHHFNGHDQALAAQVSVEGFYAKLGFTTCGEHYLEDGIAHVDMVRRVNRD